MKPVKLKPTRIHRTSDGAKFAYDKRNGWLRWHNSSLGACFCGWLPVPKPKHIKG